MATAPAVPPGVNLNDDLGPQVVAAVAVVTVLSTVAIILRFVARYLKNAPLGWSDWLIIIGWLCAWGVAGIEFFAVNMGLGKHIEIVPPENLVKILQVTIASEVLYCIVLVAVKLSILCLYCSIFPSKGFEVVSRIVGAFVVAWGIACILVSIFSCNPVEGFWNVTMQMTGQAQCISTRNFFIGNSVPNIIMDVVILALPIKNIWQLQMSFSHKMIVTVMFLLGGFVVVSSGVRLYFLLGMDPIDITWTYYDAAVWSVVELNMSIICGCLPTMRPIFSTTGLKIKSLISSVSSRTAASTKGASSDGSSNASSRGNHSQAAFAFDKQYGSAHHKQKIYYPAMGASDAGNSV